MKMILAIATSSAAELKGRRTGLWLSELTHFMDVVERAGFGVDVASPQGGPVPIDEGSRKSQHKDPVNARYLADPGFVAKLENSLKCSEVDASRYVAIYLSGGHGTMYDFRQSSALRALITQFHSADHYLTGVCHGVSGFIDAVDEQGQLIVRGRVTTGFSNFEDGLAGVKKRLPFLLEDELKKNGAQYRKNLIPFTERVELDGKLITGQNPQSARGVGEKLVEQLNS